MQKFPNSKIIFSSYDDLKNPYYGGGGAMAIHQVAKRLVNKYQVTVLTGKYANCKNQKIDGVNYKRIGVSWGLPKLEQLLFHLFLIRQVAQEDFDVWLESFTPPFSTSFLPLFTKKPVIGLVHMLAASDMERKYKLPFHLIENIGLRFYKNFIVTSENFKKKILKQNPKAKVEVIPLGVNLPAGEAISTKRKDKKYLLFIGRIEVNQKGLDLLLHAFRGIVDKLNYPLVIAGSGEEKEIDQLKNIIKIHGLEKKVQLLGRLEEDEKKEVFEKAAIVIIPSRFETFSLVALEALSYNVPIVCFDIEGLNWLPKNICLKVKPFDIEGLAIAMLNLSKNEKEKKRIINKGKEHLKKYSWDSATKVYDDGINNVRPPLKDSPLKVKNIVDQHIKCYFISPHFDDAVFSAGGLISYLSDKTKVTVVNVFTKGGEKPYTSSGKHYLNQCGYKDASKLFTDRKIEDGEVLKGVKVRIINLGFKDALWRKKKNGFFTNSLGKVLPEVSHIYPTYKFNVKQGVISENDRPMMVELEGKLTKLVKRESLVFCPVGVGNHVDHVIVREVCRKVFGNPIFWSDYPYNLTQKFNGEFVNKRFFKKFVFRNNFSKKERLVKGYKTQIKAIFPMGEINLVPEVYYSGSTII